MRAGVAAVVAVLKSIKITGRPVFARDEPATVRIGSWTFFERDADLNRSYCGGLWQRGRSAYAKAALAKKAAAK